MLSKLQLKELGLESRVKSINVEQTLIDSYYQNIRNQASSTANTLGITIPEVYSNIGFSPRGFFVDCYNFIGNHDNLTLITDNVVSRIQDLENNYEDIIKSQVETPEWFEFLDPSNIHSYKKSNRKWKTAAITLGSLALMGLTTISGCLGSNDSDNNGNEPSFEIDADGDYINRTIELANGLDPNNAYSYGGVHDFLRLYVYPHFFTDKNVTIEDFKKAIPNIEPAYWNNTDGGFYEDGKYTNISLIDPLFQYYADKVHIEWEDNEQYGKIGHLKLNDERLFQSSGKYNTSSNSGAAPIYYLTHGRRGVCVESAICNDAIFKYKGYLSTLVSVTISGRGHLCGEVKIGNERYVVNFNNIIPLYDLEGNSLYENEDWVLRENYDPNWISNNNENHA